MRWKRKTFDQAIGRTGHEKAHDHREMMDFDAQRNDVLAVVVWRIEAVAEENIADVEEDNCSGVMMESMAPLLD